MQDLVGKNCVILFMRINIETRPMMGGCLPDQPGFINQKHVINGNLNIARSKR